MLDTRQVAELTKVQYHDIDNLVRFGVLSPVRQGRGKARQFDLLDVVSAKVAILMRDDGYSTDKIKQAVELIKLNWQPGDVTGGVWIDGNNNLEWDDARMLMKSRDDTVVAIKHIPNKYYGVADIASEVNIEDD